MFKTFLAAALFAAVQAADVKDESAGAQCEIVTASDSPTTFNISSLEKSETPYTMTLDGATITWNYCTYAADVGDSKAYAIYTSGETVTDLATYGPSFSTITSLKDSAGSVNGLSMTQKSTSDCIAAVEGTSEAVPYTWTTSITCSEDEKNLQIGDVSWSANGCDYSVAYEGPAGCPTVSFEEELGFLRDNPWAVGVIYLIIGPLIALRGLKWFPYITATVTALFTMGVVAAFSMTLGFTNTEGGAWGTLGVAFVLGLLAAFLIYRAFWIMIAVLGLVGGFFGGTLLFSLIVAMSGWSEIWAFWVIAVLCAVAGCFVAYKTGKGVVLILTSLIGSFFFMRAWTLFFPGHWPSEAEIMNGAVDDMGWQFWTFVGVFGLSSFVSIIFQSKTTDEKDYDQFERA